MVTRREEAVVPFVVDDEGKHAAQIVQEFLSFIQVQRDNRLAVRSRQRLENDNGTWSEECTLDEYSYFVGEWNSVLNWSRFFHHALQGPAVTLNRHELNEEPTVLYRTL